MKGNKHRPRKYRQTRQQKQLKSGLQRDLAALVALGYIQEVATDIYTLTPKGKAYVEDLS